MVNKIWAIVLLLSIAIFTFHMIVASLVSVKINPDNIANQRAYGQIVIERPDLPYCQYIMENNIVSSKEFVYCMQVYKLQPNDNGTMQKAVDKFEKETENMTKLESATHLRKQVEQGIMDMFSQN